MDHKIVLRFDVNIGQRLPSTPLLGSATVFDSLAGTLTPTAPLATVAGKQYTITFIHCSGYSGPNERDPFVDIVWNNNVVATITSGDSPWQYYSFMVTGVGNDVLAFHGGKAPGLSLMTFMSTRFNDMPFEVAIS